jgi:hypothetical protein
MNDFLIFDSREGGIVLSSLHWLKLVLQAGGNELLACQNAFVAFQYCVEYFV